MEDRIVYACGCEGHGCYMICELSMRAWGPYDSDATCPECGHGVEAINLDALLRERDEWRDLAGAAQVQLAAARDERDELQEKIEASRERGRVMHDQILRVCGCSSDWSDTTPDCSTCGQPIRFINIDGLQAKHARLEAEVRRLRESLENLRDEQSGPPLENRREQWQEAMRQADEALAEKGGE
ncbi:MAG: hypothetical protein GF393_04005 [Armatimonadia bacterium]|nr:hypothetical protein [Armatimonadia bacterium]